jgi:arsenate reductase (thioredoxin)
MSYRKIKILFLCTGNSCRSQMAEGLARHLKDDLIESYSAGTEPKGLDPRAVKVMAEIGIDISAQRSKHVDEFAGLKFDYVITLCGGVTETCPFFRGAATFIHRGFDDPPALAQNAIDEDDALTHYRKVRDQIRSFIEAMPQSLKNPDS